MALEDGLRQQYEWVKSQIEKADAINNSKEFSDILPVSTSHHVGLKTVLLSSQETSSSLTQIAITELHKGDLWILMCILPWMNTIIYGRRRAYDDS